MNRGPIPVIPRDFVALAAIPISFDFLMPANVHSDSRLIRIRGY
jgi:hypothetical protein